MTHLTSVCSTTSSNLRRSVIAFARLFILVLALSVFGAASGQAQRSGGPDQVNIDDLHKQGALKDLVVGKSDAPVTIVEYASLTCGHCATFHNQVYPKIKETYIDTGKVRMIMREFPLNARAYAASMITRCVSDGAREALVDGLFETQGEWAFKRENKEFKQALFNFTKQAGLSEDDFNKCLANNDLLNNLTGQFTKASQVFGVNATPAFFVNGKRLRGTPTFENVDEAIKAALGAGAKSDDKAASEGDTKKDADSK